MPDSDAVSQCEGVVRSIGCSVGNGVSTDETLRCLRQKPLTELIGPATDYASIGGFPWQPIGDSAYSSDPFFSDGSGGVPKQLILSGPVLNVPIMMGNVRDEGLFETTVLLRDKQSEQSFLDNFEDIIVAVAFSIDFSDITSADRAFFDDIVGFYEIAGSPSVQTALQKYTDFYTDTDFAYGQFATALKWSNVAPGA